MCVGSLGMVNTGGGCGVRVISFITMTRAMNRSKEIHLFTSLAFSRESGDSDKSPDGSLIMCAILLRSGSSLCSRTRLNFQFLTSAGTRSSHAASVAPHSLMNGKASSSRLRCSILSFSNRSGYFRGSGPFNYADSGSLFALMPSTILYQHKN
jgi:hypothetical protein